MPLCAEPAAARRNRRRVREIYLASFPREERMPFFLMCLLAKMPQTQFLAFREGEQVCGFAYMAVLDVMEFLLFLAVDPALRSRGYGSAILREIAALYRAASASSPSSAATRRRTTPRSACAAGSSICAMGMPRPDTSWSFPAKSRKSFCKTGTLTRRSALPSSRSTATAPCARRSSAPTAESNARRGGPRTQVLGPPRLCPLIPARSRAPGRSWRTGAGPPPRRRVGAQGYRARPPPARTRAPPAPRPAARPRCARRSAPRAARAAQFVRSCASPPEGSLRPGHALQAVHGAQALGRLLDAAPERRGIARARLRPECAHRQRLAPPHGLDAPGEALSAQHGQHSLSAAALFHRAGFIIPPRSRAPGRSWRTGAGPPPRCRAGAQGYRARRLRPERAHRQRPAPPHGLDAPGEALPAQHGQHSLSAAALLRRRVHSGQVTRSRPFMALRRWAASSMPRRSAGVSRAPASGQNARTSSARPRRTASMRPAKRSPRSTGST